jgi:hypothetical protein
VRHSLSTDQAVGGAADGPVTALDIAKATDHLVSGYASGRVILWDAMRGAALKAVGGLHDMPVSAVRFVLEDAPRVLSVDVRGVAQLTTFSNRLVGWGHEATRLLDGGVGQVVAVAVLPNYKPPSVAGGGGAGAAGLRHIASAGPLVALSTREATLIVALLPEPRVVHRWKRPDDAGAQELPCLAWARARVSSDVRRYPDAPLVVASGVAAPVLARGWGSHLQLLQVQPEGGFGDAAAAARGGGDDDADAAAPAPARGGPLRLSRPWRELSFVGASDLECSVAVHGVAWLSEHVLVYLNGDFEVVVFDTLAMTELDAVAIDQMGVVCQTLPAPPPSLRGGVVEEVCVRGGGGVRGYI